ncbi:hypothetical protein KAT24_00480 [Candidatus Pacearchaeota archaeon]|nr:hypothetical protein [Candidatus Pacearchaeota archaeon]
MKGGKKSKKKTADSKKKISKKSKNKKISKKKNSFNNKKLLAISIAAFFILAIALAFVNVPQNASVTGRQVNGEEDSGKIQSAIKGMFDKWEGGEQFDANIIKYIFWFTILILVVGALSFINFPKSGFLRFLLGLGVSFLTVIYITPGELYNILAAYTALGLTLTSVLPFIVMLGTSAMLVSNEKISEMNPGKILLEVGLWVVWSLFLLYRLIKLWAEKGTYMIFKEGGFVLIIILALSVLIIVFNKPFRDWISKIGLEVREKRAKVKRAEAVEREKTETAKAEAAELSGKEL